MRNARTIPGSPRNRKISWGGKYGAKREKSKAAA